MLNNSDIAHLLQNFKTISQRYENELTHCLCNQTLTRAQWEVLTLISNHRGIGTSELAELTSRSVSSACSMVDKLEAEGLIDRAREDEDGDRRRVRLHLTDKGMQLLSTVLDQVNMASTDFEQYFTPEEIQNMLEITCRALHRLEEDGLS